MADIRALRDIAANYGWIVCDDAADEIERLEKDKASLIAENAGLRNDAEMLSAISDGVIGNEAWIYDFMTDEHPVNKTQFNDAMKSAIDNAMDEGRVG
jgi:hypothetical protein